MISQRYLGNQVKHSVVFRFFGHFLLIFVNSALMSIQFLKKKSFKLCGMLFFINLCTTSFGFMFQLPCVYKDPYSFYAISFKLHWKLHYCSMASCMCHYYFPVNLF